MEDTEEITMYKACLLHSRADRALRLVIARQLERFNVTMMEWLLMGAVSTGTKDGMSMTAVAEALDVTLPQVTALTASLTKAKLLKQKVSRKDRRSRKLVCTATGKKLFDEVEKAADVGMKNWLADIPDEQLDIYFGTVKILADRRPQE